MKRYRPILLILFALCLLPSTARADRNVNGSITANGQAITMSTDGVGTVRFIVAGTWTGTLGLQSLGPDGATWTPISFYRTDDGTGAKTSTFTVNVAGKQTSAAMIAVRIAATASWTGTATISINGSSASGVVEAVLAGAVTGSFTDASATIATGGTAQTALALSTSRKKVYIQNTSLTAYVTFSFTTTAGAQGTAGSAILQPGQFWSSDVDGCPTGAISVYSPTTGATVWIMYL